MWRFCLPISTGCIHAITCRIMPHCWPTLCDGPANGDIPLQLEGRGLFDCNLYTQPGRVIAHVVNLTATGRMPVTDDDLIPAGPLKMGVRLPAGVHGRSVRMLVANKPLTSTVAAGWARVVVPSVLDHEVLVIE